MFYLFPFAILNIIMETPKQESPLRELKNYLTHLKDLGYTEIPCEAELLNRSSSLKTNPSLSTNNMASKNSKSLTAVQKELGDCTRCKLSEGRKNIVFGSGNPIIVVVMVNET